MLFHGWTGLVHVSAVGALVSAATIGMRILFASARSPRTATGVPAR